MRFVWGIVAFFLWLYFAVSLTEAGIFETVSDDAAFLSLAIVTAGAMAGGGKHV